MSSGLVLFDFDRDGWLDVFFANGTSWPGRPGAPTFSALYRNDRDGTFTDVTKAAGLAVPMFAIGTAAADYDNDGWKDLYVTAIGGNRLFRNLGNGTFADVTAKAGTRGPGTFGTSAMFFDYDRDGHLDIVIANYVTWTIDKDLFCTLDGKTKSYCTPESYKGESPTLFRNRGDGTFEDATRKAGLWDPTSKALGVALIDHDEDGWPDFVLANDTQPNKLYRNNHDGTFTDVGTTAGIAFGETGVARAGMGIDSADYSDVGRASLLVANFSNEMIGLYHNEGNGLYVDEAPASTVGRASMLTLAFGIFFFDYDLDGRLDIFAGNGHVADDIAAVQPSVTHAQAPHVFRNTGNRHFEPVAARLGPALRKPIVARGIAHGDLDNDGDLDVVVSTNNGPAVVFRNDGGNRNRFLRVRTTGTKSNRDGIGAKVTITLADGSRQWRLVRTGSSYCSQSDVAVTFGLGGHAAGRVDRGRLAERAGGPHGAGGREPGGVRRGGPRSRLLEAPSPQGVSPGTLSPGRRPDENGGMSLRRAALLLCLVLVAAGAAPRPSARAQAPASPAAGPSAAREAAWRENNLGVALLEQFRFADAVLAFGRALEKDPALLAARINLAIAHLYVPDIPAAKQAAEEALKAAPDAPQPNYILALIARSEGRAEDAVPYVRKVLAADPKDLGANVTLGQVHLQMRQFEEAAAAFRVALAAEPYNVSAAYNLGVALTRAGKREEGQEAMARFQKLRDSAYKSALGSNYLEQGKYAEALASTGAEPEAVDPKAPAVSFVEKGEALPGAATLVLADLDADGVLDAVAAGKGGLRLLRGGAQGFADVTEKAGVAGVAASAAVAGDYDNDGLPDLLVAGPGGVSLRHNEGGLRFAEEKAPLPAFPHPVAAAAFVDIDHDGDLDVFVSAAAADGKALLLQNNGDRTFADITATAQLAVAGGAVAVVPTDFDNRRDVDLFVLKRDRPALFKNVRDGSFKDLAAELGLLAPGPFRCAAAGDVNKDGYTDFFLGAEAESSLALSDGRGAFRVAPAPKAAAGALAAQLLDADNDGLLDLLVVTARGERLLRNLGGTWADVSATAFAAPAKGQAAEAAALAAADLDADGDTDALVATPAALRRLVNEGGNRNRSFAVQLVGRVSSKGGVGAKVEIRAGSLRQKIETSAAVPMAAPADVVFGLGERKAPDAVRIIWVSGIVQTETETGAVEAAGPPAGSRRERARPQAFLLPLPLRVERGALLVPDRLSRRAGRWATTSRPAFGATPTRSSTCASPGCPRAARRALRAARHERARGGPVPGPPAARRRRPPGRGPRLPRRGHDVAAEAVPPGGGPRPADSPGDRPPRARRDRPAGEGRPGLRGGPADRADPRVREGARAHPRPLRPPAVAHGPPPDRVDRLRVLERQRRRPPGRPGDEGAPAGGGARGRHVGDGGRAGGDPRGPAADRRRRPRRDPGPVAARPRGDDDARVLGRGLGRRACAGGGPRARGARPRPGRPRRAGLLGRGDRRRAPRLRLRPRLVALPLEDDARPLHARGRREAASRRGGRRLRRLEARGRGGPRASIRPRCRRSRAGRARTFLLHGVGWSKEMDINSASPDIVLPLPYHGMKAYPYADADAPPAARRAAEQAEAWNTRLVVRPIVPIELHAAAAPAPAR